MDLNLIGFGNPTIEQLKEVNRETYLDKYFAELTAFTFPANSSEATKEEINSIIKDINDLRKDTEAQERYRLYDLDMATYFGRYLQSYKVDGKKIRELTLNIYDDVYPLVFKLKFFFQRPRPSQLAYYYKAKLMPFDSLMSNNPSFPSGHAVISKCVAEVLGNTYPEIYGELQNLHLDICKSRVAMGLHYQSDIDVGIYIAERILRDKEFMFKFKL